MAVFSMDCKYISENTEDVGAPIVSPSFVHKEYLETESSFV
jgi:hypothetical protein